MLSPKFHDFRRHREMGDTMILLQSRATAERFMTAVETDSVVEDLTRTDDGRLSYDILGYARDVADGQLYLYGRSFTTPEHQNINSGI